MAPSFDESKWHPLGKMESGNVKEQSTKVEGGPLFVGGSFAFHVIHVFQQKQINQSRGIVSNGNIL